VLASASAIHIHSNTGPSIEATFGEGVHSGTGSSLAHFFVRVEVDIMTKALDYHTQEIIIAANIFIVGLKLLTMTNTLAYYIMVLNTAAISFLVEHFRVIQ
jgi:hypothetical protein